MEWFVVKERGFVISVSLKRRPVNRDKGRSDVLPGFCVGGNTGSWVLCRVLLGSQDGRQRYVSSVWKLKPWWQMVWLKPEENCSSDPKEEVMMVWHRADMPVPDRHALNKSVAEGSREQVDAFVFAGTRSCWWRTLAWRKSKNCNSLVGVNEVNKMVVGKEEHCEVVDGYWW